MFTVAVSKQLPRTSVIAGKKKMRKRLRKFGRKLANDRRDDLQRMADKIGEICREEERRSKELFREHREFFDDDDYKPQSIDFFEN
jgi:hypothetical protein